MNYEHSDSDDEIFNNNKNTKIIGGKSKTTTYFSDDDSSSDNNSDLGSEDDDFKGGADSDKDIEEGEIDENENIDVNENVENKEDEEYEDDGDEENNDDDDDEGDLDIDENSEYGEIIKDKPTSKEKKNIGKKKSQNVKSNSKTIQLPIDDDYDDDEDEEYNESYLQKFDNEISKNYVDEFHPECHIHNYDEISKLTTVVRDSFGIIIDPLHKTIPYLTKYEKARVIGQRAKQIENGSKPFIRVPENIIDGYIIAELELQQKRIPFIIRRPIPSGGCEYWNIKDLEIISF